MTRHCVCNGICHANIARSDLDAGDSRIGRAVSDKRGDCVALPLRLAHQFLAGCAARAKHNYFHGEHVIPDRVILSIRRPLPMRLPPFPPATLRFARCGGVPRRVRHQSAMTGLRRSRASVFSGSGFLPSDFGREGRGPPRVGSALPRPGGPLHESAFVLYMFSWSRARTRRPPRVSVRNRFLSRNPQPIG